MLLGARHDLANLSTGLLGDSHYCVKGHPLVKFGLYLLSSAVSGLC